MGHHVVVKLSHTAFFAKKSAKTKVPVSSWMRKIFHDFVSNLEPRYLNLDLPPCREHFMNSELEKYRMFQPIMNPRFG